jgi:hypothetical protein
MRHLVPVLKRELTCVAGECSRWTLVCMWFVTDGLLQVVAAINGLTPDHVIHPVVTQLDAPHHLTKSR